MIKPGTSHIIGHSSPVAAVAVRGAARFPALPLAPGRLRRRAVWLLLLLAWLAAWLPVQAQTPAQTESRFPKPEFETGYQQPSTTAPGPRALILEYADVAVLLLFLGLASWLALRRRSRKGLLVLSVLAILFFGFWRRGCVCAVGSVQNLALAFGDTTYHIPLGVILFFSLPLLTALVAGRTFCGAVCPLGALQDVVVWKPRTVPKWLAHLLGLIPHVYLGLAVVLAYLGAGFVICQFDPFVGFFRFGGTFAMLAFGVLVLLLGMFIGRPYCRFLCPYGVLLGWLSRLSRRHLTITPDKCIKCRLCEDACPFGAIQFPSAPKLPEPRAAGVRRLALLLASAPLIIAAAGWVTSRAMGPLARLHPRVELAEQMAAESAESAPPGATLQTQAFRASGQELRALYEDALARRASFRRAGWGLGIFFGVVFTAKLLGLSVHRRRDDYEPDRSLCLSCGRCIESCPVEHQRRRDKPARHTETS